MLSRIDLLAPRRSVDSPQGRAVQQAAHGIGIVPIFAALESSIDESEYTRVLAGLGRGHPHSLSSSRLTR